MRRSLHLLLLGLALISCKNEVQKTNFKIALQGYSFHEAYSNQDECISRFEHRAGGGFWLFSSGSEVYTFLLHGQTIEDAQFALPPGTYLLEVDCPPASLYGQAFGSYRTEATEMEIGPSADTLSLFLESNCALLLINDKRHQLENGAFIIEKHSYAHGYYSMHPLEMDSASGLYYCYFTPDTSLSDPSAFIWLYGKDSGVESGGIPTNTFEKGFQYYMEVLE